MSESTVAPDKPNLPVVITPEIVKLKMTGEVVKQKKPTLQECETRALKVVKNEDNLKVMADLLKDLDNIEDIAEAVFKPGKQPHLDAGRAWDAGKKLVLTETARIRGMFKKDYDRLLAGVAEKDRKKKLKEDTDKAIKAGIESNLVTLSTKIVAATTKQELLAVERLINLQKSPSMASKYGEFHPQAIERYDTTLLPILKDQKAKLGILEDLNAQVLEAEKNNDPDKMDALNEKIDGVSNEILQNHANVQEAVLMADSFPVVEGIEVLPAFKVKRTNYSIEIDDIDIALKKARELLEFSINKEEAKKVLEGLKEKDAFKDVDEVVVNGIKYIATKIREAL